MKIPNKIKIGGHNIEIIFTKDGTKDRGSDSMGTSVLTQNRIFIDQRNCQQQQEATFIHEIIEVINFQGELDLEHKKITILENSLYQVLVDNKLLK